MPSSKLFRLTYHLSNQYWTSNTLFSSGFQIQKCIIQSNYWLIMLGYSQHRIDLQLKAMISKYLCLLFSLVGLWLLSRNKNCLWLPHANLIGYADHMLPSWMSFLMLICLNWSNLHKLLGELGPTFFMR